MKTIQIETVGFDAITGKKYRQKDTPVSPAWPITFLLFLELTAHIDLGCFALWAQKCFQHLIGRDSYSLEGWLLEFIWKNRESVDPWFESHGRRHRCVIWVWSKVFSWGQQGWQIWLADSIILHKILFIQWGHRHEKPSSYCTWSNRHCQFRPIYYSQNWFKKYSRNRIIIFGGWQPDKI